MTTKLIVTNKKRLRAKYKGTGLKKIEARLRKLIAADKKRGVTTEWVAMDIQSDVGPRSAPKINDPNDPQETKDCVDAIFANAQPDYVMILGSPDVVCLQPLINPIIGDEDEDVPSDLPYACDAGFSEEISDFVGSTRVVGRIPDIAGESNPASLLAALDTAIAWKRRRLIAYDSYCAISTDSWKKSTQKSLRKIFGRKTVRYVSPPAGQPWSKVELKPRVHFVNCHGQDFDTAFYGDDGAGSQPLAIDQADYDGRMREGTVIAAECCFGAELYEAPLIPMPPGISNTAMVNGVYGYLGSTNVAYGPADNNGYADLVCQYFLSNVRNGASVGRALLEARQRYSSSEAPLDPVDLKTLAQFNLLGDPSVHPVRMSPKTQRTIAKSKSRATTDARRRTLSRKGLRIGLSIAHVYSKVDEKIAHQMRAYLTDQLQSKRYSTTVEVISFAVHSAKQPALAKSKAAKRKAEGGGRYHVVSAFDTGRQQPVERYSTKKKAKGPGPDVLLVALEANNEIQSIKKIYRR